MDLNSRAQLILTGLGILSATFAWWRWVHPRLRALGRLFYAALVSLAGRDPIHDEVTGRSLPAIPPLHVRLAGIEQTQQTQADALNKLANVQSEQLDLAKVVSELHRVQVDHEARIGSLEDVDAERSLTREESAAVWRAIANKDALEEGENQ